MHVKTPEDWERERDGLLDELRRFAALYRKRPFPNREGLRGVSAFALYWFLKRIRPTVVLEVGVWRGFSTWLIEQAVPEAEVFCFDPIFYLEPYLHPKRLGKTYRSPAAVHSKQDFSCADVQAIVSGHARPLVFFDDHQNALSRLIQASAVGIDEIIFDDNTAVFDTHRTLELERSDAASRAFLEDRIETYEVFPALWKVDAVLGVQTICEKGMDFPLDGALKEIHSERMWHSYVTHVRLRPESAP
jgi:hypothetical protein